jgi:hypothetical protein
VLIGDDLPELSTNLVAALASLDVDDFSHFRFSSVGRYLWGVNGGGKEVESG